MKVRQPVAIDGMHLTHPHSRLHLVPDRGRYCDAEQERDTGLQIRGQGRAPSDV